MDAVNGVRTIVGATNPADAAPGTIRGELSLSIIRSPSFQVPFYTMNYFFYTV